MSTTIKDVLNWKPAKVIRGFVDNITTNKTSVIFVLSDFFNSTVLKDRDHSDIYITSENYSGKTLFKSSEARLNQEGQIEIELNVSKEEIPLNFERAYPLFIHIGDKKYKLPVEEDMDLPVFFDKNHNVYFEFYITKYKKLRIRKIKREESVLLREVNINKSTIALSLTLFLPVLLKFIQKAPEQFYLDIDLITNQKKKTIQINLKDIKFLPNFTAEITQVLPIDKLAAIHNLQFTLRKEGSENLMRELPVYTADKAMIVDRALFIDDLVFVADTLLDEEKPFVYSLKVRKKLLEPRVSRIEKMTLDRFKIGLAVHGYDLDTTQPIALVFIERQTKAMLEYPTTFNEANNQLETIIDHEQTLKNRHFATGVWDAFLKEGNKTFRVANPRQHDISDYSAYSYPQIVVGDGKDNFSLKLYYTGNGYLSLFVRDYVIFKNVKSISVADSKLSIKGNVNIMKPNQGLSAHYEGNIVIPVPEANPINLDIMIQLEKTDLNDIEYSFSIESVNVIDERAKDMIISAKNFDNWIVSSTSDLLKYKFPIVINKELEIQKDIKKKSQNKLSDFVEGMKIPVYQLLTKLMPVKKNVYMFQSFYGNNYSCNPRAIYERLYELEGNKNQYVWVLKDEQLFSGEKATVVKPNSWKYFYLLARAKYLVNNANFPDFFVKRKGTTFLQTWHGTPLKKLGLDVSKSTQAYNANNDEKLLERTRTWDLLIAPNEYTSEKMKSAYELNIPIKSIGYPRNDQLVRPNQEKLEQVRKFFNIPEGKKVILYAPTWREDDDKRENYRLKFNIKRFYETLKDDYVILLRLHYFDARRMQLKDYSDFIINATNYNDIADLYNIADILITDYSSVMFDYSITGKPILFFQYDYDKYKNNLRGFYIDFEAIAPGPILKSSRDLLTAVTKIDKVKAEYKEKYREFKITYNIHENGTASEQALKALGVKVGDE